MDDPVDPSQGGLLWGTNGGPNRGPAEFSLKFWVDAASIRRWPFLNRFCVDLRVSSAFLPFPPRTLGGISFGGSFGSCVLCASFRNSRVRTNDSTIVYACKIVLVRVRQGTASPKDWTR